MRLEASWLIYRSFGCFCRAAAGGLPAERNAWTPVSSPEPGQPWEQLSSACGESSRGTATSSEPQGQRSCKSHGWGSSCVQQHGKAPGHISCLSRAPCCTDRAAAVQLCPSFADPEGLITTSLAGTSPFPALPTCKISLSRNDVLWIKVRELKETTPQRLQQAPSLGTGEGFPSMNHLTVFYFI